MQEERLAQAREAVRRQAQQKFADESRSRLGKVIKRKIMTSFISAVSDFETTFGPELWGHGLDASCVTPGQRLNAERWAQVRKRIFNNGHAQIRAVEAELALHEIKFKGYHADVVVGGQQDGKAKDDH